MSNDTKLKRFSMHKLNILEYQKVTVCQTTPTLTNFSFHHPENVFC